MPDISGNGMEGGENSPPSTISPSACPKLNVCGDVVTDEMAQANSKTPRTPRSRANFPQ
jgi:hypothetical protein